MISQNKYIIPLQDEKYNLAFNIFPLDTIKYNDNNFKQKITDSIINAIEIAEGKQTTSEVATGIDVITYYNIQGYQVSDVGERLYSSLYNFGKTLGFYLFDNRSTNEYKYVGAFDTEEPKKAILNTKLLIDNIVSTYFNIVSNSNENRIEDPARFEYLTKDISIDIIISPFYDKNEILKKIESIMRNDIKYNITVLYRSDYESFVIEQYAKIGDLKILKQK